MSKKEKWLRILFYIGVAALIGGLIDPLEGSIVIAIGSLLVCLSTYLRHDRQWKFFGVFFIAIVVGVFFLFYLSSLGGFGGTSDLSWWWGALILPYPIGWLASLVLIIIRAFIKKKIQTPKNNSN